jgi:hypothetical protein
MNLRHVLVLLVAAAGLVAPAFSTTETDSGAAGTSGADVATGSSGTAGSTGAAAIVGTAGTEGATGGAEPCTGRINLSAVGTYNPHAVDPGDFTTHEVNAIAVDGTLAYVALNHNRIHAVDISDPTTPTLVDSLASPAFANRDVVLGNGVAFVGGEDSNAVMAVDTTTPRSLAMDGSYAARLALTTDLLLRGNRLYVVFAGAVGMHILDVSDTSSMTILGEFDLESGRSVAVSGNTAFLTDREHVYAVDVTDPTTPTELDSLLTGKLHFDIVVSGSHAFVAAGYDGVRVFDISDPSSMVEVGGFATDSWTNVLALSGDYLLVGDDLPTLYVLDITNPTNPVEVATYSPAGGLELMEMKGLTVSGEHVFHSQLTSGRMEIVQFCAPR